MENSVFEIKNLYIVVIIVVFTSCGGARSTEDITGGIYTTLTTAKKYGGVSPKPAILHRRINVAIEDNRRTPLPERRSHLEAIWKWDFWCQLQPKTGKCTSDDHEGKSTQRFYYDAQLDACQSFVYSGCDGNKNNFPTLVECERHCKGSVFMTINETTKTTFCELQQNVGQCMALIQRYYYDVNENDCKVFLFGGCGGNQNRFKTHAQCMEACNEEK